jgi:hypothetical protein
MDVTQSNIETVDKALEQILAGDLDLSLFEDGARWGVAEFLPEGGLHTGRDAIRTMLANRRERFPGGYRLRRMSIWGTPDRVFVECTRAPEAAGEERGEHIALMFTLVVGRIRDVREFAYSRR